MRPLYVNKPLSRKSSFDSLIYLFLTTWDLSLPWLTTEIKEVMQLCLKRVNTLY